MKWLKQVVLPGQDNQLLASEPEVLKRKISESNGMVKEMAKSDRRVKLLRNIPTLGPFFSVLVAREIDASASSGMIRGCVLMLVWCHLPTP